MSLSIPQLLLLTELLIFFLGIAITWAVFYGSERAELPGEAQIPPPDTPDDLVVDTRGRTLN